MDNDRIERILRRVTAALPRRKVAAVLFSATPLLWLAGLVTRALGARRRTCRGETESLGLNRPSQMLEAGRGVLRQQRLLRVPVLDARTGRRRNTCRCRPTASKCGPICCAVGKACCDRCADLQTDPNNCGACFTACATDETCVAGSCTV